MTAKKGPPGPAAQLLAFVQLGHLKAWQIGLDKGVVTITVETHGPPSLAFSERGPNVDAASLRVLERLADAGLVEPPSPPA